MARFQKRDFWILGALGLILLIPLFFSARNISLPGTQAPEIKSILALKNTADQAKELNKLLTRVGPIEAQEELLHSGLPFTGETHLLVHTVGNFIYDEYGKDGLSYCKDYFLSACYHAVILNTLGDDGMKGVVEALNLCYEAGGYTVLSQCAHGAGHGFVAWHDYDLLKALKMCDELGEAYTLSTPSVERGSPASSFPYFNCYDGIFMENIWGVHEGAPSPKRWVKTDDLYYPCNDPKIPEKYKNGCWSNQATLAYQHFGGNLRKTAEFCDTVENTLYQETCYNNFARQIHPLTQGSVDKVKSYCGIATGKSWQDYCIITNMVSYWSVGDHELPYKICESLEDPLKNACFTRLRQLQSI